MLIVSFIELSHLCTSGHASEGSIKKKKQYFLYLLSTHLSPQTLPRSSSTSLSLFYVLIFLSNSQSAVCAAHRHPLKHTQPIKDDIPKENLPFTSTHQLSVAPQLVV